MNFLPWFKHTEAGYRTVWQPVLLPSLNRGSGTSRFANHNTVGTGFALPSLHANVVSRLAPLFPPSSVYFGCPLLFPNGNFEVDWCCLFRANGSKHKGDRMRDGWRVEQRQQEANGESLTFNRQWRTSSHVFFISAGVWSQMEQGESWLTRLCCAHIHERRTCSARYSPPSTTSTDCKPVQSRGLYFPRPWCQFRLMTLPRLGFWQCKKTLRF